MTTKQLRNKLKAHFSFSKMPFTKGMLATQMFDSSSQRELLVGLQMWTEVRGLCLVVGPTGVGKSITLRRFLGGLDSARFRVIDFAHLPCTVHGFLRSLCRSVELPMRAHTTDLFDSLKSYLATHEQEHGAHPLLVIDDAEGLRPSVLDTLRRLTAFALDSEERFSVLLSGTDSLVPLLADPNLSSLRSRILYSCALRPFGFEDTVNYVRFHLQRADANQALFSDPAIKRIFQASLGRPRAINQLAVQALIQAAMHGIDTIDGDFIAQLVAIHPLFHNQPGEK